MIKKIDDLSARIAILENSSTGTTDSGTTGTTDSGTTGTTDSGTTGTTDSGTTDSGTTGTTDSGTTGTTDSGTTGTTDSGTTGTTDSGTTGNTANNNNTSTSTTNNVCIEFETGTDKSVPAGPVYGPNEVYTIGQTFISNNNGKKGRFRIGDGAAQGFIAPSTSKHVKIMPNDPVLSPFAADPAPYNNYAHHSGNSIWVRSCLFGLDIDHTDGDQNLATLVGGKPDYPKSACINYGETGGIVFLSINGHNIGIAPGDNGSRPNMSDYHGWLTPDNHRVIVTRFPTPTSHNHHGIIYIIPTGTHHADIKSIKIGGQELYVDNYCLPIPPGKTPPTFDPNPNYNPNKSTTTSGN